MDADDNDWKKKVGFPINYDSSQSDDDFDTDGVVMRHPRQSSRYLLADEGDGSEADQLGTTPPRSRIRDKEKRRTIIDSGTSLQRLIREKKDVVDYPMPEYASLGNDRLKKRLSLKVIRAKDRDWKQDMEHRDMKADSLPSPNPTPVVPLPLPLVESCNRFMSLRSTKCRELCESELRSCEDGVEQRRSGPEHGIGQQVPASRVTFHKTFSMLINMGNVDKACRRTISREEQVWQNELKDLIWLEIKAKIAGRSLAQQDAWLCTQRDILPTLIKNIFDYRFVNDYPCKNICKRQHTVEGGFTEDLASHDDDEGKNIINDVWSGCLELDCMQCSSAVGRAMREVSTLLDSYHAAESLYPSTKAMTNEHPLVATQLFKNRMKAMCLWFNIALNMRLKMFLMRRLLRSMRNKTERHQHASQRSAHASDINRQSSESHRVSQVQFMTSSNPSDSSGSELSAHSDIIKEEYPTDLDRVTELGEQKRSYHDDEIDSGVESARQSHTGQTTPEIVVSDSAYSSSNSTLAQECAGSWWSYADVFDLGDLHDLTRLRLLGKCQVSPYREHHREILKTQGVRRSMMYLNKMRQHILDKAFLTIDKPDVNVLQSGQMLEDEQVEVFAEEDNKKENVHDENNNSAQELRRYGCWSGECVAMRLPSYRSHFLLLSSICLEAVHDYLAFRLESRPDHPSCLTVKQLIHELKEGLDIASEFRAEFIRYARGAALNPLTSTTGHSTAALISNQKTTAPPDLTLLLQTFDSTADAVLKQYLSYLRTMSETEHMSRACLQAEWQFTATLAKRIRCAAILAPLTFTDIACNQLNRMRNVFEEKLQQLVEVEETEHDQTRESVYAACRIAQRIYAEERERTLQSAHWARALASRLARAPAPAYIQQRNMIFNSLMSIRDFIVKNVEYILDKSLTPTPTPTAADVHKDINDGVVGRVRELLLQVFKFGFELHKELYSFAQTPYKLAEERRLRRYRPSSLQPAPSPALVCKTRTRRRPDTIILHESINPMVHKELHRFVNESTLSIARSGRRRSGGGGSGNIMPSRGNLRSRLLRADSVLDDAFDDKLFDNTFVEGQSGASIEMLVPGSATTCGGDAGSDQSTSEGEVSEEGEWAGRVARAVIQFAKCWMMFVVNRCDRGRGTRPRWASQGLEFLMLACDPCNTKHLTDNEFEELKQLMDGCISHVIGSRNATPRTPDTTVIVTSPRPRHRMHSPLSSNSTCGGREAPTQQPPPPPTPPSEPDPLLCFNTTESLLHSRRVSEATQQLDMERDHRLRNVRAVGCVLHKHVSAYEPKLRQLTFKWQRGLKIGAGTFGKVYTVVNTESGQLLAMKEISIGAGDRHALQRAANELQVLEGIVHPHLVRYYGCELHREEMLLFMELCVEGSLEALVGTSGPLPEHITRRYTKQLVCALQALHQRSIVHRDVKSGNIFLTNEGHCLKLGDFGCAVKIRAHTTAPGELQGFVGTQAYMAPEVFMNPSGHGRAADIWSLGCVVTEMGSGKRPFSEHDYTNYHIMFKVGMGERPHIPTDTLSEEGQDFCLICLTHDPADRPRAEELASHTFLMVKSDDDCQCEPAYLIT